MGSNRFLDRLNAKYLAGMAQYNAFPPNLPTPRIKAFNDAYKARFGEESHGFAAQSYDGLHVAVEAMAKAGTVTDGKAIRDALAGDLDRRRHRPDQVRRQGPGVAAGLHHPMVRRRHGAAWCFPRQYKADCGGG